MKLKLVLILSLGIVGLKGQNQVSEPSAIMIMDRMASVIGDLQSCSFSLSVANDVEEYPFGIITQFTENEVYMVGPDKMLVQSRSDSHHKGVWYNGDKVVYYSYSENNYAVMEAPEDILTTIDSIHHKYGVDFPAADFFYPTFTDDVLAHFDDVQYVGEKSIGGQDCFHIRAANGDMIVQFWIANDAMNLPLKFSVKYLKKEGYPRYEATFKNWKVNPTLPEAIFEFTPPPGARQVSIAVKSDN